MGKQGLQKDKSLKTKTERKESFNTVAYKFTKNLLEELQKAYIQTYTNGCDNLWIVKPGGLSRGRQIKIFDNYSEICNHAGIAPVMPNGPVPVELQQ